MDDEAKRRLLPGLATVAEMLRGFVERIQKRQGMRH